MRSGYTQRDKLDQVCILASIWIETLFYGFYTCLFTTAMFLMTRRGSNENASTTLRLFFAAIVAMFITATFHEFIVTYRLIRAFGWILGPEGTPISYFHESLLWDNYAPTVMLGIMIWIGDAVVIFRCYLIWGRNWRIIVLPSLLFLSTMSINITLYVWYGNQFTNFTKILPVIDAGYPLTFAQNFITTALIAWKIIKQHRSSRASGLGISSRGSLINVVRIVVESAFLYPLELLLLIVLYFTNSPVQFIIQGAIIPSIGIVFVLIAIRVHIVREQSTARDAGFVPSWVADPVFRNSRNFTTNNGNGEVGVSVGVVSDRESYPLQILSPQRKSEGGNRGEMEHGKRKIGLIDHV